MPSIESFRTKRRVARLTDDAVHFDESAVGYARSLYRGYWQSEERWRKAIFLGYVSELLFAIGWLVSAIHAGDKLLLAGLLSILTILVRVNYARGFRAPDRIPLDDIEDVSTTRGEKGLTRPRLVITYLDDESTYKRRVNLPSLYTADGEAAYERALDAFGERGFDTG